MRKNLWVLEGKTFRPAVDLNEWGKYMQRSDRILFRTVVEDSLISTVFLGMDHSMDLDAKVPVLFETIVFGGPFDQKDVWRHRTYEEAETFHKQVVEDLTEWHENELGIDNPKVCTDREAVDKLFEAAHEQAIKSFEEEFGKLEDELGDDDEQEDI